MSSPHLRLVAGAAAMFVCAFVFATAIGTRAQEPEGNYGVGIPDVFLSKYLTYRTQQLNSSTPNVLRIRLGYVKGLSRSFTAMAGETALNLDSGAFNVSLNGLTPGQTYSVWLVDRPESDLLPDAVIQLATVLATGTSTLLSGFLPLNLPVGFTIDRAVVAPGPVWGSEALAAGSVTVFQKIFFRRLTLRNDSTGAILFEEITPPPSLFALVPDVGDEADPLTSPPSIPALPGLGTPPSSGRSVKADRLISQGAQLFFENTFGGNGRVCGTCHPASNNFTIDADFISTVPATDPLFVAEFNPALAQLERPELMRSYGLILENLDGLSDPTNKFVMRGVPHTLGLQVSLQRDSTLLNAPAEMTGWSADGAPGTGSLREFALGAVTQHFTKDLARVEGRDFKLPRDRQLDAMEAFQLSLGRDRDFNLSKITFQDPRVENGKSLFINGSGDPLAAGTCAFCHSNGGALALVGSENRNFNTNVEDVSHPARSVENFPHDGGFGRTANPDDTFGDRTFNTAPVVEAGDTGPFFHNNVVSTLEGVVDFYDGPEFNGPRPALLQFNFNPTQRDDIADFIRGLNTLQNIDVARRELKEILANRNNPGTEQGRRLRTALDETQDAIDVLNEGGVFASAVTLLTQARNLVVEAQRTGDSSRRRMLVQQAIAKLDEARNAVATIVP